MRNAGVYLIMLSLIGGGCAEECPMRSERDATATVALRAREPHKAIYNEALKCLHAGEREAARRYFIEAYRRTEKGSAWRRVVKDRFETAFGYGIEEEPDRSGEVVVWHALPYTPESAAEEMPDSPALKAAERYPYLKNCLTVEFRGVELREAMERLERQLGRKIPYRIESKNAKPIQFLKLNDASAYQIIAWLAALSDTAVEWTDATIIFVEDAAAENGGANDEE